MTETKLCRPCGHNHPATGEFFSRRRDGRLQECRDVTRRRALAWHEKNRDEHNARMRSYAAANKEATAARSHRYYEEHRDELIERTMTSKLADPAAERQRCANKEARRRAQKMVGSAEDVDRLIVFERDEGTCGICREPVDRKTFHLDHVVPLSKGGTHTYANVQVAHPSCNLAKSNRLDFATDLIAGGENVAI